MTRRPAAPLSFGALLLCAAVTACGTTPTPSMPDPSGAAASWPAGSHPPAVPDLAGRRDAIGDPAAGLGAVPAYRATLTLSFSGTQANQPADWSQTYELTVVRPTGTRALAYRQTGLGDGPAPLAALDAYTDAGHYTVDSDGAACVTSPLVEGEVPPTIEPAARLPRIGRMIASGGPQQVAGMEAVAWTFGPDAIGTKGAGSATGGVTGSATVASSTGLVLRYDLSLAGGHDVFDADTEGTMTWSYALEPLDPATASPLPADCPLPLPDVPLTADAADVVRYPGYVRYETRQDLDAVTAFYRQAMPAAGFTAEAEPAVGAMGATMAWTKDGRSFQVVATTGTPVSVRITAKAPADAPNPSPAPRPTSAAEAGMVRVARSLTLLLGSDSEPSALGSYHVVSAGDSPYWESGKVRRDVTKVTGDVAGQDVHFVVRETRGTRKTTTEGYRVGGTDYEVTGGKVRADGGLASIAWLSWPLDAVVGIGIGSLRTEAAGTAEVDGRPAEVYRIKGSVKDDPSGMFASFGLPITSTDGTVWVDQATGALLKADVRYVADVKDADGKHGSSKGSFSVEVTKAGAVTVALP